MANDFLAQAEETRAEGNVRFALEVASRPGHPSAGSLPLYADSARQAFEAAAANTEQPASRP
ncbi:hypothetical protein [Streptomyces sp. DW26H14]|uniref:hypothetical protein n=1 Tax=Streptomyces sp. DW26H14 TaxID=3435395 RepID=UPI00403DA02F